MEDKSNYISGGRHPVIKAIKSEEDKNDEEYVEYTLMKVGVTDKNDRQYHVVTTYYGNKKKNDGAYYVEHSCDEGGHEQWTLLRK